MSSRPRLSLNFLGTCSGGGPVKKRCCSSSFLAVNNSRWMIDCADGTQMQFLKKGLSAADVDRHEKLRLNKIFITHMHIDHCLGVVPIMSIAMSGVHGTNDEDLKMEIYGPSGIRQLIRITLQITQARLNGKYAVHELLDKDDTPYSCDDALRHPNELPGRDILQGRDRFWREFVTADGLEVDAGPILHRAKCLGYVFRDAEKPKDNSACRKLVVLGDTHDPSPITELAKDASILVHEASRPVERDGKGEETKQRAKAIARGHSTPRMAGDFAREIGARRLVMNHLPSWYPGPDANAIEAKGRKSLAACWRGMEAQATSAWKGQGEPSNRKGRGGKHKKKHNGWNTALTAFDFMRVDIDTHIPKEDPAWELGVINNS